MFKSLELIEQHKVKWVDLRFTDISGQQHHLTMPARDADEDFFEQGMSGAMFKIHSAQAPWSTAEPNAGHQVPVRSGYMPVAPNDPDHEIRTAMCNALEDMLA